MSICELCGRKEDSALLCGGNVVCSHCAEELVPGFVFIPEKIDPGFDPNSVPREKWTCKSCGRNLKDIPHEWLEVNRTGIFCNHCNSL